MNETNATGAPASASTKRNMVLGVCGVALAGLGLAAGLALRPGSAATQPDYPAVATTQTTNAAPVPAAPTAQTRADEQPQPQPQYASPQRRTVPPRHVAEAAPQAQYEPSSRPVQPLPIQPVAVCSSCGVVEGVREVQQEGHGSGVGAVAGGLLGGVLGNHVGGGAGRAAATVLGAVGGGFAGNEVEKRTRTNTVYDVRVRMDDGSLRTFQRTSPMSPGAHVVVDGQSLRIADTNGSNGYGS